MSNTPASVLDVASYILTRQGPITTWKLQKLVYYCQAWSLVWDDDQIFPEEIKAWANGPVVRELYDVHRGEYRVEKLRKGNPEALTQEQRSTGRGCVGPLREDVSPTLKRPNPRRRSMEASSRWSSSWHSRKQDNLKRELGRILR